MSLESCDYKIFNYLRNQLQVSQHCYSPIIVDPSVCFWTEASIWFVQTNQGLEIINVLDLRLECYCRFYFNNFLYHFNLPFSSYVQYVPLYWLVAWSFIGIGSITYPLSFCVTVNYNELKRLCQLHGVRIYKNTNFNLSISSQTLPLDYQNFLYL